MSGFSFSERIARIRVYPAADGYALGEHVALLASNEAPFAPLPEVAEAAARAAAGAHRYPDPSATRLRKAIAGATGVGFDCISVGNGSCDILLAAGEALLEPGREVVYAWPAFSMYPQLAESSGATAVEVPLDANERHDADALVAAVTPLTRMLIICNPNNPTGTMLNLAQLTKLLDQVPDEVCVVLDEAYREFVGEEDPDATIELLKKHRNLLILRTFSKVYGLAALRVGYGLCADPALKVALDQVRQPFFCNAAAQAGAVEALRHTEEISRRVDQVRESRKQLVDDLEALGLHCADSQANFLWVKLPDAVDETALVTSLREREILVRAGTPLGGPGHLRITIGLPEELARLVTALGELLP